MPFALPIAFAACQGDPPGTRTATGLFIQAETRVVNTVPSSIETTVRVTKPGDPAAAELLSACDFRVRAYRTATHLDRAVWDGRRRQLGCPAIKIHRWPAEYSPPGQFTLSVPTLEFLGDSLPAGRYHFTVSISPNERLNRDTTEVSAGSADLPAEPVVEHIVDPIKRTRDGLALRAETRLVGGHLKTVEIAVTVTNTRTQFSSFVFGSCPARVRAHRLGDRSGRMAWDSNRLQFRLPPGISCPTDEWVRGLAPDSSVSPTSLRTRIPVPDFLGDSLLPDRYEFITSFRLNGDSVELVAGTTRLGR
jgi:hypothetical protein